MIRVEPGSTPGIGITITEYFFFGFFRLLREKCFAFLQGELVACYCCSSSGAGRILRSTLLQILGLGDYILLHQVRQCR